MKAAVCPRYGPPSVIEIVDVPKPEPAADELLIRVTTSTVNRTTSCIRACIPAWGARPAYGFIRPRRPVLGTDFAGVVEAVGPEVRDLAPGDRVFGFDDSRMGAHGEFMTLPAAAAVSRIPDHVGDDDAAAVVEGVHYASTTVERADLAEGSTVLVYGGGGAIGTAAVQLFAAQGVVVTAVAEDHQLELMRRLGASTVVDYRAQDFTAIDERFDLVFDAVGKTTFDACRPLIRTGGMFMATELGPRLQNLRLAITTRFVGDHRVHFPLPLRAREHVKAARDGLASGTLQAVIDRTYDLDDIVDAYRYVETASKTGSVLLRVAPALK